MKTYILNLVALCLLLSSCAKTTAGVSTDDSVAPPGQVSPVVPPTVTEVAPLALQIFTNYEGTQANIYQAFVETGTVSCQATKAAPNPTCTIQVPEGRLYYSQMHFQFSWYTSKCKLLSFLPYYYMSSAVDFIPPWSTALVPCSTLPRPSSCWGGAAPYLVPGFPRFAGLIYIPDETIPAGPQTHTETLPSAHSLSYNSSRLSVNDLPLAKRGTAYAANAINAGSEPYIANTFVDYQFTCQDDWADPVNYSIKLNIQDVDSAAGNGPIDNFFSWKEAP